MKETLTQLLHRIFYAPPKWDKASKASCWTGSNAAIRLMNILSPHMDNNTFDGRVKWMKNRGCNTAHVFLSNEADGQYAGYCPYGSSWSWKVDKAVCQTMRERIRALRRAGMAVVVWLFADDSRSFNRTAATDFVRFAKECKAQGLFDLASTVVVGLELNEYYPNPSQVAALVAAVRKVYGGKIGTHQTSGRIDFAGLADMFFFQVNPGISAERVEAEARNVIRATGKPLNFFEIERQECRDKAEAALRGGAFGVGNW